MLYAIHDESGKINQANKLYDADPDRYDVMLNDRNLTFVKVNAPGLLPPEHWYVNVGAKELSERPVMSITVSKTRIKAGDPDDSALLTGIPAGARFEVLTSNVSVHSGPLDGTELQLFIPVPCIYQVKINLWPFKEFQIEIEAYT